jgi:hypothetical protein
MNIVALMLLAVTGLVTGCVGLIPVPSFSGEAPVGRVIQAQEAAFIVPGQTTRAQVVEQLGADFRPSPRLPVIAYSWDLPGGTALWWWVVFCTEGGAGNAGEFEWGRWRAFFVAFDQDGYVTKTKFKRLSDRKSLDEQLEAWGRLVMQNKTMIASPSTGRLTKDSQ